MLAEIECCFVERSFTDQAPQVELIALDATTEASKFVSLKVDGEAGAIE